MKLCIFKYYLRSKVYELTELIEKISDVKLNEPVKPIKYPRN